MEGIKALMCLHEPERAFLKRKTSVATKPSSKIEKGLFLDIQKVYPTWRSCIAIIIGQLDIRSSCEADD